MPSLYPLVDVDACDRAGLSPFDLARWLVHAGVGRLQVRAKSWGARATLDLLRELRPITQAAGCLLFANDRADLALLAQCDGVHVGQRDLTVEAVRQIAPSLQVGLSTHSLQELSAAVQAGPDYVAFGPVFSTRSKQAPEPEVGVDGLAQAYVKAKAKAIPLVAIGGLTAENAWLVAKHCDEAALIGAITCTDQAQVELQLGRLRQALAG